MDENLNISKEAPKLESMRYDELRELGIQHIQKLAGKLWTDYNTHDPGVTILEVLSYAITELGYRSNQKIEDILAPDPTKPEQKDIKNFFTAAEILPNKPLTLNDLRKLIIDVSVTDESDEECDFVGVKNAWITLAEHPEVRVWADITENELTFENGNKDELKIGPLYNILLEFESCKTHGDLNRNILIETIPLEEPGIAELSQVRIEVEMEFARWDDETVDWTEKEEIRKTAQKPSVRVLNIPTGYRIDVEIDDDNIFTLSGTAPGNGLLVLDASSSHLNAAIDGMAEKYRAKVMKVHSIVKKVKARIHSNRNLCEDYLKLNALKVEKIAVCADIELELEADVEEVQAQIQHRIASFLSPPVPFYSLGEMAEKGISTEEIFEGPLLDHGYVIDSELEKSARRKVIYVSDLVQIIMNIESVAAIRHIEIANIPEGAEDEIEPKSVKWCLHLAHHLNYVPRFSAADSKITFYKEQLPYQANRSKVRERVMVLESETETGKIRNPVRDLKPPKGKFLGLDSYSSIKEEFPAAYGVGFDGLPSTVSRARKMQARQLRGYLLFFEQLLANYMAQLSHVKDLYSMNAERGENGQFKIGRTYYTQNLIELIPESKELFDDGGYPDELNKMAESKELFIQRRNKFLDHLMARFAEQFTDYATLTYRLTEMDQETDGKERLIRDKLTFLNAYPEISSSRGVAFNYRDRCKLWHIDNKSGLERRASLQVGIDDTPPENLAFSDHFVITETGGVFGFEVRNNADEVLLTQPDGASFSRRTEAAEVVEELIVNGVQREKYEITGEAGTFSFVIRCGSRIIAVSSKTDFASEVDTEGVISDLMKIFEDEFFNNPESNRNNFTVPIDNYFDINAEQTGTTYTIEYTLYDTPYSNDPEDALLTGSAEGSAETEAEATTEMEERSEEFIWDVISNGGRKDRYIFFEGEDGKGRLRLTSRFGQELGISPKEFSTTDEASAETEKLAKFFYEKFLSNEGLHLVEHILLRPRVNDETVQNPLMSIYYDPDCEHCQLTNPYKYIASVVLPYWQGRFGNMDFRRFFERKIRFEAPAHVFLRVCWISNRQMQEFETSYKKWLILNAREEKDPEELSKALGSLIDILEKLRNVYPVGRLHDCEASDTLEEAMILNNSILGSA